MADLTTALMLGDRSPSIMAMLERLEYEPIPVAPRLYDPLTDCPMAACDDCLIADYAVMLDDGLCQSCLHDYTR